MMTDQMPMANTRLPCCNRRASVKKRFLGALVHARCECGGIRKDFDGEIIQAPSQDHLKIKWTKRETGNRTA